jgi:DNA-binding XRE family transcriptional regulator
MPTIVRNARANPDTLPSTGGGFRVVFEGRTNTGSSRLRAAYSLDQGVSYALTGSTTLSPTAVSVAPRNYEKSLTLQRNGAPANAVDVTLTIDEVDAAGAVLDTQVLSCRVMLALPAAARQSGLEGASGLEGTTASLGDRLRAHRDANDLTQQDVADRAGISRSHVSDIERGETNPSDEVRGKLEKMME